MEKAQNFIKGITIIGVLSIVYGIIISFANVNILPGIGYYALGILLIIIGTILDKAFEEIKGEFYHIYTRLERIEQEQRNERDRRND